MRLTIYNSSETISGLNNKKRKWNAKALQELDSGRSSLWAAFSGALFVGLGLVAFNLATYQSSLSTDAGLYVNVLGKSAIVVVVGFLLLLVGLWNVLAMKSMRRLVSLLGLIASFIGAIDTVPLVTVFAGVNFNLLGAQSGVSQLLLWSGAILVLFVGFPLGVMSSTSGLAKPEETQNA